jgi:hypothetical protein
VFRTTATPTLILRTVPVLALAAVVLTGCGPAASAGNAAAATSPGSRPSGQFRGFGGVSGPIASVGPGSFTVTDTGGKATVDYTTTTVFTRTASGTLASVRTGSCVSVVETSGSDATTGSVDANTVRISPAVNGGCAGPGAAFGGGGIGGGFRGRFRTGGGTGEGGTGGFGGGQLPSGAPNGGSGGTGGIGGTGGGSVVAGTVTSTTPTGFVVTVPAASGTASPAAGAGTTTAVNVSSATTYSVTSTTTAASLAVGECARVFSGVTGARPSGSAAPATTPPAGPVTAASVTLSPPVNGGCTDLSRGPSRSAGSSGSSGSGSSAGATGGA